MRSYEIDGVKYPSVTEILDAAFPTDWEKKALEYDAIHGVGAWERRRLARSHEGKLLHKSAQTYLEGNPHPTVAPSIRTYWESLLEGLATLPPHNVIALEEPVVNKELGYAGTPDAVLELESGSRWLLDFKTFEGYQLHRGGSQDTWPLWKRSIKKVPRPQEPGWEWTTPIFRRALLQGCLYKLALDLQTPEKQIEKISVWVATKNCGLQKIAFPYRLWNDCYQEAISIVEKFHQAQRPNSRQ
jgi:hypothetical protein